MPSQTDEYHEVKSLLWKICAPILLLLGIFGNIFSILVLRSLQAQRTRAVNILLMALAVSDLTVLCSALLTRWFIWQTGLNLRILSSASCKIIEWLSYSSSATSSWLLMAITVERVLSVRRPVTAISLFAPNKTILYVVAIAVCFLTINSHLLAHIDIMPVGIANFSVCTITRRECAIAQHWIHMTQNAIIPSLVICVGNAVLLHGLWRNHRKVLAINLLSSYHVTQHKARISYLTRVLIALSMYFMLSTLPANIFHLLPETVAEGDHFRGQIGLLHDSLQLLWFSNYVMNFYIYNMTASAFRQELERRLLCGSLPSQQKQTAANVATIKGEVRTGNSGGASIAAGGSERELPRMEMRISVLSV